MGRKIRIQDLQTPLEVKKVKVEKILSYDIDNAYPTRMERLINASVTAKSAAGMLARFLTGKGFVDETLNTLVVGKDEYHRKITLYKLLTQIAKSISKHNGYYVRVQYDGNFDVTGLKHTPFKHCRLGLPDDSDYKSHIVIYDNWDKSKGGSVLKKDHKAIHIYNKDKTIIEAQIKKAGSIEKYKGQMYFEYTDDEYVYPLSMIDSVYWDCDTESQIQKFKNGELRRGFFLKYIIHHTVFENEEEANDFKKKISNMMGGDHEISFMLCAGNFGDDGKLIANENIQVEKIDQNINSKLFESYESGAINNIRKAFNAIPQVLIDYESGKLGTTSGEALIQASNFYNQQCEDMRKQIEQGIKELLSGWKDEDIRKKNIEIEPLIIGTNGSTVDNNGTADD